MSDELDIAVYIISALPTPPTGMLMSSAFSAACRIFGARAVDDIAHGPGLTVLLTVTSPETSRGPGVRTVVDSLSTLIASELRSRGGSCIVDVASLGTVSGTGPAREAVEHWVEHLSAATTVSSPSAAYRERLEDMLRTHAIRTLFQPIVDAASGSVVAYESLSRGSLGKPTVSAPELFEAARMSGLEDVVCSEMSRLAIHRARHLLSDDVLLFVNIAPEERWQGTWLGVDIAGDASPPWPAHRTVLELTERAPITDVEAFVHRRERARDTGVRFALDDAGAGYAGLATLAILAPEYIKVDIALVQGCNRDPIKRSVIGALVYLAREIGAAVVAEGVEAVADLETVRDLGVDLVQGHLVARPAEEPPTVVLPWEHGAADDGVGVHATGHAIRRRRSSQPRRH